MVPRFYLKIISIAFLAMTPGIPVTAGAAEWTAEPAITGRHEYNDNINLSIHPHNSVRGSFLSPSLSLGVNTPVWQAVVGLSATQRRYSGQTGLDRDDKTSSFSTAYRTERNVLQFSASRSLDSLLATDLITPDTGVARAQRQTETRSLSPSWTWSYSELTTMQVVYQQSDVSYEDDIQTGGLYDYEYSVTTAVLNRQISGLTQIFATGGYSRFRVSGTGFRSETRSLQVGATRTFSETLQGTFQAGRRITESFTRGGNPIYTRFSTVINGQVVDVLVQTGVTRDGRDEDTGTVFSGSLDRKFEQALARLTVSRSLNPTGSGGQTEQDSLGLKISQPLTARLTFSLGANRFKTRVFDGNITNSDLTYYDLSSGLSWQWSRDWTVGLNYKYGHVRRVSESESAESNSVFAFVTFRPPKMSASR